MCLPTHVLLDTNCEIKGLSVVILERVRTIDLAIKRKEYVGTVTDAKKIHAIVMES